MTSPLAFLLPALLLFLMAVMMLEQSKRWAATALVRSHFTQTEFEIDFLRDEGGKHGFSLDGHIVSSGENVHISSAGNNVVPYERLRELQAAGRVRGAREPVRYLPPDAPGAFLHPIVVNFRVQDPERFEVDAPGWVVVNVLAALGAFFLCRRGIRLASGQMPAQTRSRRARK
jgi:hypothetical protein